MEVSKRGIPWACPGSQYATWGGRLRAHKRLQKGTAEQEQNPTVMNRALDFVRFECTSCTGIRVSVRTGTSVYLGRGCGRRELPEACYLTQVRGLWEGVAALGIPGERLWKA